MELEGVASAAIRALLPGLCPACDEPLSGRDRGLCAACWAAVVPRAGGACPHCGTAVADDTEPCLSCLRSEPPHAGLVVWGEHDGGLRSAVLALKHGRRDDLAGALGARLASLVAVQPWLSRVDLVTWVPSHKVRRLRRPWAAAELLARTVAHDLALPVRSVLARRGLDRQTGRSRARRLQLPSRSFAARRLHRGPGVLVVDDVTTTGATMRRVSAALLAAGAAVVFGAVLAQTPDPRRVI